MSMIRALLAFVESCPLVAAAGYAQVGADLAEAGKPAVATGESKVWKRFMDGSCLLECGFALLLQERQMVENGSRLAAHDFCGGFAAWVADMQRLGVYPAMGAGWRVLRMEAMPRGMTELLADGSGVYRVDMALTMIGSAGQTRG